MSRTPLALPIVVVLALAVTPTALPAQELSIAPEELIADAVHANDVEVSAFGTYVVTYDATENNSIRVFDADFNLIWRHRMNAYWSNSWDPGSVVQIAPDESFMLFPGYRSDSDIVVCDPANGREIAILSDHRDDRYVSDIALSPDGSRLVSSSSNELFLWERDGPGFAVVAAERSFGGSVQALEFLPDGDRFVLSGREDNSRFVRIYRRRGDELERVFQFSFRDNNISHDIYHLAVSPDGRWIVAGYRDSLLIFAIDGEDAGLEQRITDIDIENVYTVAFAPDSLAFVSAHWRYLRVWQLQGSEWREGLTVSTQQPVPNDVEFSRDGRSLYLASVADENAVIRFSVEGIGASALGRVVELLGGSLSAEQKQVLTEDAAERIIEATGESLLAPRDMFETAEEHEERRRVARARVGGQIQELVEARYPLEREENPAALYDLVLPLTSQGSYDIDRRIYTIALFEDTASVSLGRDEARDLYRNWQRAVVRMTRFERDGATDYADFRLVHPVNGIEYPILLDRNPFTGQPLNPAARSVPAVPVGTDLVVRDLALEGLFPTLYRWYESESLGRFSLENTGTGIVTDLRILFGIDDLVEPPQSMQVPSSLAAGQSVSVELTAPLAETVLQSTVGRTVAARLEISYRRGEDRRAEVITRQVTVLNRNAIQWRDDRRVGAFMTVNDPVLVGWSSNVSSAVTLPRSNLLTRELVSAMNILEGLRVSGIRYVVDPTSAYQQLSADEYAVDYLKFPAETLSQSSGDCDDLSVLYATLLEAVGVPTAFITTPGHIFAAFDAGIDPDVAPRLFAGQENLIIRDGRTWIPVETTILNEGFARAWQVGALQWRQGIADGSALLIQTADIWRTYSPVPLPTDEDLELPESAAIAAGVGQELAAIRDTELEPKIAEVTSEMGERNAAPVNNRLGVLYAEYGLLDQASRYFDRATAGGDYVPALVNQANVLSLAGRHDEAREYLERAQRAAPENARVLLGLAFSHWTSGNQEPARRAYERVTQLRPTLADRYPLFDDSSSGQTGRASSAVSLDLFGTDWAESGDE